MDLTQRDQLIKAAQTSLASKVVSQNSEDLAPLAVDAVLSVIEGPNPENVDLNNVRVVKAMGGTIDETELVRGLVFANKTSHVAGAPTRIVNAKIGLIQFCLSAPKTDIENQVVISEYSAMDRILREERKYILDLCKAIQKSGCNVLLVQKSILRDAVNGACGSAAGARRSIPGGCSVCLLFYCVCVCAATLQCEHGVVVRWYRSHPPFPALYSRARAVDSLHSFTCAHAHILCTSASPLSVHLLSVYIHAMLYIPCMC